MSVEIFYKEYAETLNECVARFRLKKPQYKNSKITYAGRLDPLADGIMLLLCDEDVHKKEEYLDLKKEYNVEFLLGIATDSYDILGIPTSNDFDNLPQEIEKELENLSHIKKQIYPAYSSKTVNGKALFRYAKDKALDSIPIPERDVHILEAEAIGCTSLHALKDKNTEFRSIIKNVQGDFRQKEIIDSWNSLSEKYPQGNIVIAKARFVVSSGTYVRSLINQLGLDLGCGACCIRITRTKVGDFTLNIN